MSTIQNRDIGEDVLPRDVFDRNFLQSMSDIAEAYNNTNIPYVIHPNDGGMLNPSEKDIRHYKADGTSAIDIIFRAMLATKISSFAKILDMPSGHGRVLRHLIAAFPQSEITACDIMPDAVQFCGDEFRVQSVLSQDDFSTLNFDSQFDLIWCGSLFSHLPQHKFVDCLRLFSRSLSPGGLAILTLHGRFSVSVGSGFYLPVEKFHRVEQAYRDCGFGYADYADTETPLTNNYGVALSSPSFVLKHVEDDVSVRIVSFKERDWNNHQDALVLQKKDIT